jgi:hypothetical protein
LMRLHSYLDETEVIGYLGGVLVLGRGWRATAADDRAADAEMAVDDDIRWETKTHPYFAPRTALDDIEIAASVSATQARKMMDANLTSVAAVSAAASANQEKEKDALYAA